MNLQKCGAGGVLLSCASRIFKNSLGGLRHILSFLRADIRRTNVPFDFLFIRHRFWNNFLIDCLNFFLLSADWAKLFAFFVADLEDFLKSGEREEKEQDGEDDCNNNGRQHLVEYHAQCGTHHDHRKHQTSGVVVHEHTLPVLKRVTFTEVEEVPVNGSDED